LFLYFLIDSLTDFWFVDYDEKDITPYGLRCRSLLSFPPKPEVKVSGPRFAAGLGRSLYINDSEAFACQRRIKSSKFEMPKRMECRQLVEYQKLNSHLKLNLMNGLRLFIYYLYLLFELKIFSNI
jgi:hypothetical protein